MVGIFTGSGSGLERGSANILGGSGLLGSASFGRSGEQLFLNAATGSLLISQSDEFLVGRGPDAAVGRIYNSLGNATDENGDNWRQSTDRRIFGETGTRGASGATVTRRSSDGSEIVYTCNGSGVYVATDGAGAYDTLTYASGTGYWTWTDGDSHTVETYEVTYASAAQWRLKQVADNSAVTMSYAYLASSDRLDTVTTADGGYIQYGWSGNNITQMVTHYTDLATGTAKTLTRIRYAYDGSNRLTSVTTDLSPADNSVADNKVYAVTYTYDGSSTRVATITESDGSSLAIGYDATSHKVVSLTQTVASGVTRVTGIAYTSSTLTTITDPLGQVTTLEYNADGSLKKITAPPAVTGATAQTAQFTYDGSGNVLTVTDALGKVTTYGGYTNGNWTTQTDPLSNVVTRTYDAANNLTSETRTGSDRTSSAASHTTRYVYDGSNRLIWMLSAEGMVTKYGYDAYGQLAKTTKYPWYFYDVSGLSATTMVSDSALVSWESGQADKTTRVIETFARDARGAIVTDTSYALADSAGNAVTTAGETIDNFVYDQAGRLLTRYRNAENHEQFVYDGLGRMTASTDINGGTTNFVFTDSTADNGTKTVITTAAGYVQTYTYNRAGDLVSMIDSGTGVTGGMTAYQYDALGRVRVGTDANSNKSYTLYDHAGRKTADVDSFGNVREYRYDADNRVVATIRWNTPISGTNLTALASPANTLEIATIRPASDPADIWSWTVYDADGRIVETIEGDGSATAYEYDASDRLVRTTVYASKLTSTQIGTIKTTPPATPLLPASSAGDSMSRLFYDKDGHVYATLDGNGYMVTTVSTFDGKPVVDKVWQAATDPSLRATGTFTALQATVFSSTAPKNYAIRDGENRLRYEIADGGYVTEYVYNDGVSAASDTDKPRKIIHYAGTIPVTVALTVAGVQSLIATAGLASNPDTRTTYLVYDGAERVAYSIDGNGAVTGFTYDTSGRLIKTVQYATLRSTGSLPSLATMASWASTTTTASDRVSRSYYTARGEVAYTIDGEGFVTGNAYDATGQRLTEKRWDTPVSATDGWTLGNVDTAVAALTSTTTAYTYDFDGRVKTVRDGAGHGHDYSYYANGLLAWDIRMSGSSTDESKTKFVYDAAGRLTDRYDGWTVSSTATHYGYDGRGNQVSVTDPNGKTLARTFDGNGNILTETDPLAGVTSYQYDSLGNVVKTTDARGNSSYSYYDSIGRLVATRDAENYVTTMTYTSFGQAATVTRHSARATNTAAVGALPAWTWDGTDVPVTTSYEYDKLGNVAKVTDPLTNYQQFTYNAFGETSVIRDARGMLTSEAYDRRGLLKTEIADTAGKAITTSYTYNSRGQVLTATDANGKVTTSTYDAAGRLVTVKDALNNTTTYTYDGRDNLVAVTDALGKITRNIYDANDRKIAAIDALGGVTTYAYDADGHLISQLEYKTRVSTGSMALQVAMSTLTLLLATNADDRTTRYAYDDDGRLRFTVDAKLHVVEMEYDAAGNVVRSTAYDGAIAGTSFTASGIATQVASLTGNPRTTRAVYDALGRLTWSIDAVGGATWFVRDAFDNIVKQVDYSVAYTASGNPTIAAMATWRASTPVVAGAAKDHTARAWFDGDGRLTYSLDALGFVTRTEYDAGGNVTKTTRYTEACSASDSTTAADLATFYATPASPQVTEYSYDTAGRLTETLDGEGSKTRVTLSQAGQVLTSTSAADTADAHVVTYTYDDVGRVLTETVQIGTAPSGSDLVTTNSYDVVGNLVKVHDARGNDSYSYYDALGQQIAMRDAESYVTETVYSTFGDVASVTRHSARATNTASTTLPTWTWSGTDVPATTLFEYNTLGQLTRSTDATGAYEQYTLGNFGERLGVRNKLGGTSTYTYDRNGQVLTETLPTGITTRNVGGTSINVVNRYEYDVFGNRITLVEADGAVEVRTTLYTYDKLDRLLTTAGDAVTVLSATLVESGYTPTQTLTYDSRGNVIKSVDADAATFFYYDRDDRLIAQISPIGTVSTFEYDGNGNRITEKVFGTAVSLPGSPGGTPPTGSGEVRETRYAYDRANRLVSTTIPAVQTGEYVGGAWVFTTGNIVTSGEYDAAGNITREIDTRGASLYHWYDKLGREVARIDQENYLTVWERDAEGNAVKETRYANKVTSAFTSGTAATSLPGLLGSGAADANRVTDFTYDKNGRRLTETRESVDYFAVDGSGTMTSGTSTSTITYTYNGLDQVLTKAEANGDTTGYTYDAIGRLTLETGQAFTDYNGVSATPRTAYGYDGLNNLISTRVQATATASDTNDRVTTYVYGSGGRLEKMLSAEGNAALAAIVSPTTAQRDAIWAQYGHFYGYDKAGRTVLERYMRAKSDTSTVTEGKVTLYDLAGRVTTQTTARLSGTTWSFTSELTGNPAYDAANMQYDAFGDLIGRGTSPAGGTAAYQEQFWYDAGGRLWKSNGGDGVLRFHLYDKAGNETLTLASTGADLSSLAGLDATVINSAGDYSLSTTGAVTTVTVYDKRGQAIATREPDREVAGSTATVLQAKTYNAFGEVLSETDGRGFTTTYSYNTMGRLTAKVAPSVSVTAANGAVSTINPTERYYYDISGRLIGVEDANSVQAHTSDPLASRVITRRLLLAGTGHGGDEALVAKEFHPDGGVFQTRYDVFGDARALVNELGNTETRDYDKLGQLIAQYHPIRAAASPGNPGTSAVQLVDHFVYDILGQRTGHWNSQFGNSVVEKTDYDAQGRVTKTVGFAGDTMTYAYSWDATLVTGGMTTSSNPFGGWTKVTTNVTASVSMTEKNDYFGRTVDEIDFGGHNYDFTYDKAGRLTARANAGGESIGYSYFNTGLIAGQTGTQGTATYSYDAAGNRKTETLTVAGTSYRNASAIYDALGRMTHWQDAGLGGTIPASTDWEYDAVGNVRYLTSTHYTLSANGTATAAPTESYWYAYDTMNRFVITRGMLTGPRGIGHIERGTGGLEIGYDLVGQRAYSIKAESHEESFWVDQGQEPPRYMTFYVDSYVLEEYLYSADGYLAATQSNRGTIDQQTLELVNPAFGNGLTIMTSELDAMGRTIHYTENGYSDGSFERSNIVYDNAGRELSETNVTTRRDTVGGNFTYYTTDLTNTYTGGLLTGQFQDTWKGSSTTRNSTNDNAIEDSRQTYAYQWWDGALQGTITNDKDNSGGVPEWSTAFTYDASGHVISTHIVDGRTRNVSFKTDQNGMVVERHEADSLLPGDPRDLSYYYAGIQLGQISNNGTDNMQYSDAVLARLVPTGATGGAFRGGTTTASPYADFEQSYDAINGQTAAGAQSYTVTGGETLPVIAQQLWGDASLWYLIADANGLTGSEMLAAGQVLTIPSKVHNSRNASDTFRPYDPNQAIGDVSPGDAKPARKNKCGTFGIILMVVIAVAVSAITAGAGAAVFGNAAGILSGMGAIAAGGTAGLGVAGLVAVAAVAGAVGSIASQGFGIAIGAQERINWKGVAIAGISSAITAGLGQIGNSANALKIAGLGAKTSPFSTALKAFATGAIRGAVANAATQGIARVTHLQEDFDYLGVALAGIGGGAAAAVGSFQTGRGALASFGRDLSGGMASGIANAGARSLITGTDFGDNLLAALPDIIGSTIGNAIGRGLASRAARDVSIDPFDSKYDGDIEAVTQTRIEEGSDYILSHGGNKLDAKLFRGAAKEDPKVRAVFRADAWAIIAIREGRGSMQDPGNLRLLRPVHGTVRLDPDAGAPYPEPETTPSGEPKPPTPIGLDEAEGLRVSNNANFGEKVVSTVAGAQDRLNKFAPETRQAVTLGIQVLKLGPVGAVASWTADKSIEYGMHATGLDEVVGNVMTAFGTLLVGTASASTLPDEDGRTGETSAAVADNGNESRLFAQGLGTLLGVSVFAKLAAKGGSKLFRRSEKPPSPVDTPKPPPVDTPKPPHVPDSVGDAVEAIIERVPLRFGPSAMDKLKTHWGDIRKLAKEEGVEMPRKFKDAGPQIESFVQDVVAKGQTRIGPYKPTGGGSHNAIWTQRGNVIVIQRPGGEFLTILDASKGGQALNLPRRP